MAQESVSIFGAGQCGTLLAVMLAKQGFMVDVYERNGDPRSEDAENSRSINLALSSRGINALQHAGVFDRVEPLLVPMSGRMVHQTDGRTELLPYGQATDELIYSVSRANLNRLVLDVADKIPNIKLHFRQQALGYERASHTVRLRDGENDQDFEINAQPLIAADGAGSVIRRSFDGTDVIGCEEDLLDHGYKELAITPGARGEFQLEPNALHIWPRGGFMLIALPNPGGDFTLTLFMRTEGDPGFASLTTPSRVEAFFEQHFADVMPLIENLVDDVINRPLGLLGTIRCRHWHDGGDLLLIGDAAHAIVPFHGQGMNLAFEDCVVLDHIMRTEGGDWAHIFHRFEQQQRANANAIADMALENYVEMRDTVRDPKFALQKELSFELERQLADYFIPRYSMVMFHADIPYAAAQSRGEIQQALLAEFTAGASNIGDVDIESAMRAVKERLAPLADVRVDRRL